MNCRHCNAELTKSLVDLGFSPPSNAYLDKNDLMQPEMNFPLRVKVCTECWLVQTEDYAKANELFAKDYAYFSSTSVSWLAHAKHYVDQITHKLELDKASFVIEIASNDGYLLQNFVRLDIPCLGVEPTQSTADFSARLGIPVEKEFFGEQYAIQLGAKVGQADLIIGNNVYAHVPDINDFTRGLQAILKPMGTITLEFPHLLNMIKYGQFDTIYHEHYSYISLIAACNIFAECGLRVYDVERLSTHGGSIRVFGCHAEANIQTESIVYEILEEERLFGLQAASTYENFQIRADKAKNDFLTFLIETKKSGKAIAAYGAAAKGNTLLNYAGVKPDLMPFVCDAADAKQGKFLPGSHIPILAPEILKIEALDYLVVFPWNLLAEVKKQIRPLVSHQLKFVTAIPELNISE